MSKNDRLSGLILSRNSVDRSFCVYFCMFPVCPLCCFIVISIDPVSEINDDDDDDDNKYSLVFCKLHVTSQY